jgi:hypothetical protein
MKKILLLLLTVTLLSVSQIANAQIINPGFETWSVNIIASPAMDPNSGNGTTGWWDYNLFSSPLAGSSPVSVIQCTDTVNSGNYSVRLETQAYSSLSWNMYKNWGYPFIGHEYNDTLGVVFNGNVDALSQSFKPGIPFTQQITQFKFYYQYKPNGNDTAECRVELLKSGIPVAGGSFKTGVATGALGWQQATIDLTYVSALIPDTLWVIFSSSSFDYKPYQGSVLWLDDVSVVLTTGVEQMLGKEKDMKIFPNPSNGYFTINHPFNNNYPQIIEIYNALGEKIFSTTNNLNGIKEIDLTNDPQGIYFVKLLEGEKVYSEKVVIQ